MEEEEEEEDGLYMEVGSHGRRRGLFFLLPSIFFFDFLIFVSVLVSCSCFDLIWAYDVKPNLPTSDGPIACLSGFVA